MTQYHTLRTRMGCTVMTPDPAGEWVRREDYEADLSYAARHDTADQSAIDRAAMAILKVEFYDCEPEMYDGVADFVANMLDDDNDHMGRARLMAVAAIRALTPADALAARVRRDAQIMREAASIVRSLASISEPQITQMTEEYRLFHIQAVSASQVFHEAAKAILARSAEIEKGQGS